MPSPANYANHSEWSDPKGFADRLSGLPTSPRALADALEEFVIHHAAARSIGFGVPDYAESDRGARSVARLLGTAIERDGRPLTAHRDLPDYLYGTCHDFALLAASVLRSDGTEARLRVGFVDYFLKDRWEDHWLCEYRVGDEWRLLDAQLGRRARDGHGIDFDVADVPRRRFRAGAEAWKAIRAGAIDPARCGVSFAGISGAWFAASNVLKDLAALTAIEVLPWDYWGPARAFSQDRTVSAEIAARFDELADALTPPPDTLEEATSVSESFPWAKPSDRVLSFAQGAFHEQAIRPQA